MSANEKSKKENEFEREDIDKYIGELAKEYRKLGGKKMPAEIIIIGGASVLINYGFREMTEDIDAEINGPSMLHDAIRTVRERNGLGKDWLNDDFQNTSSYTNALRQYATYYKTFANCIRVYTIKDEYLVAMKLVSGREYKKDMSDIVGILYEQRRLGSNLSFCDIDRAMTELYGSWEKVKTYPKEVLECSMESDNLQDLFVKQQQRECEARNTLKEIQNKYPNLINTDNIGDIIAAAIKKKS